MSSYVLIYGRPAFCPPGLIDSIGIIDDHPQSSDRYEVRGLPWIRAEGGREFALFGTPQNDDLIISDALPLSPILIPDMWIITGGYIPGEPALWGGIRATVDSLSLHSNSAPVPEPATMLLLGTGLVGLIGTSIKKKKV